MNAVENLRMSMITLKTMALKPGVNQLSDRQLDENKDQIAALIKCKMVKEINLQKAEKPEEGAGDDTLLKDYKANEAIELVGKTVDEATLKDWQTKESRVTVLDAIEEQLQKLEETVVKAKKKKTKKDD